MEGLKFEVIIDPDLPPRVEGAVSFETGGEGPRTYGPGRVGPLLAFFEDLISGAPMPLTFAARRVSGPHTVLAATLFFDRDLAIHAGTPGLVYTVDLLYRMGDTMLGHVEPSLGQFLRGVAAFFPSSLSKTEQGQRLATAMQWMRAYLVDGSVPNIGPVAAHVRILDVGTNGFVLASSPRVGVETWETLFRWGHLRGILVGEEVSSGLRPVIAARKSDKVGFNLERVVPILNELEQLSGGTSAWSQRGNYLHSPPDGSTILVRYMVEVMLRA